MSNYTAIAGVSRSLRLLLRDRMENLVDVTIAPPDKKISGKEGKRLNMYLYQVTENGFLKNQEIPGHGNPGAYGHPPLSLDLCYLLTAYGTNETSDDADLEAQQVLGDSMRVLHDFSIVTDGLAITRAAAGTVGSPILDPSLIGEFEKVRITLQPLSLEDITKIWTAMPESSFRRSVAYQVSVVQIESQAKRRFPKLVGEPEKAGPRVYAVPFPNPRIDALRVIRQDDPKKEERPYPYVRIGDTLVIEGANLAGDSVRVQIGSVEVTGSVSGNRMEVAVPDDSALQPGAQTVQIISELKLGEPPTPHVGFRSNLAVFMLVPYIKILDDTTTPGTVILNGSRLYAEDEECMALIDEHISKADDFTIKTAGQISFALPAGLGSGKHLVRVRVNGAENIDRMELTIP
jgi:hypothetical protein